MPGKHSNLPPLSDIPSGSGTISISHKSLIIRVNFSLSYPCLYTQDSRQYETWYQYLLVLWDGQFQIYFPIFEVRIFFISVYAAKACISKHFPIKGSRNSLLLQAYGAIKPIFISDSNGNFNSTCLVSQVMQLYSRHVHRLWDISDSKHKSDR